MCGQDVVRIDCCRLAYYGGAEAQFPIHPVGLLGGDLQPRALALVVEWASLHEAELVENWRRLHSDETPQRALRSIEFVMRRAASAR
jgi:hypothetical protein